MKALFFAVTLVIALLGCARDSNLIAPGDRLKITFGGWGYGVSQLSVVDTNGTVLIGDRTYVRLQGNSMSEATNAICRSVYVTDGKTNAIIGASVRKIAPIPAPLSLSVFQSGDSNVVFRLTNTTTNSYRVPSAGYAYSDFYIPVNTNSAYAIVHIPVYGVGLWLTGNWRYVGLEWMKASRQDWEARLKIRTLRPDEHLDVIRDIGPFAELLNDSNVVFKFDFQIPHDWAEDYGLWEGSLSATGLTGRITN